VVEFHEEKQRSPFGALTWVRAQATLVDTFVPIVRFDMRAIGVRELKERASQVLRRVRERGEEVAVTHHGRVVARLIPVSRERPRPRAAAATWATLDRVAREIGFPVMLKATAGGGGKGLRLVKEEGELRSSLRMAKSEAKSAFSDDSVYIEKYIEQPRHVEIQILGDPHGNYVHLCERECSIQRRHQKVIEESPSVIVTPEMRAAMGKVAIEAARAVRYEGAGTCEFLVDGKRNFYFLEMNTRLQVEHPVTEMVTGFDIVKEQIRVATGEKLSIRQEDVRQTGHAIECRVYAEDPDRNFFPCPGLITSLRTPGGPGVRDDSGVFEGFEIPIYYDPIISKLVAWGKNRTEAIARMKRALNEYVVTGVKTTIPFHIRVMNNRHFIEGNFDTNFIDKVFFKEEEERRLEHGDVAMITAAIQVFLEERKRAMARKPVEAAGPVSMWKYSTRPGMRKLG